MKLTYDLISRMVDHSLLQPTLTDRQLEEGCHLALDYGVASVCIKPYAVPLAARILAGSVVGVGTTIGFPHGGHATAIKLAESRRAIDEGAVELDMVVNVGQVLSGRWVEVRDEIGSITDMAHAARSIVKVIFENCYLDDDQKRRLCAICGEVGADYVKTSTGYGTGGSTPADLILMRGATPQPVRLKAAGGVRDLDAVIRCVELGCERIGLSRTAEILDSLTDRLGLPRVVSRETRAPSNDGY